MKDRLKELRKDLHMNQSDFGSRIGLKQPTIAGYENGSRIPIDPIIISICKEYNVSEKWLRTGEGEMYDLPEDETAAIVSELIDESNPLYDLILSVVKSYQELDPAGRKVIDQFVASTLSNIEKGKE